MNKDMGFFKFEYFIEVFPELLKKVPYTLWLGTIAFIIALFIGIVISFTQQSKNTIIRTLTRIYISYFRSTPYITQLFILYFGLPQIFECMRTMKASVALVISIAMNSSAFISEIIRGALLSVDKGQMEAGISIGMTRLQLTKNIIFPQSLVAAIPGLGNSYVNMIKSTSMGFTIGVVELLSQAKIGSSISYRFLEAYVAAGIIYWILIIIINKLQYMYEKRIRRFV